VLDICVSIGIESYGAVEDELDEPDGLDELDGLDVLDELDSGIETISNRRDGVRICYNLDKGTSQRRNVVSPQW
jgi:hypothetical protein